MTSAMRIAYIVTAYKNPDQAVRLIRRLDADDVHFFVHVDKKTNESDSARIVAPLNGLPHVHFLARHRCDWGGFGHVKATIKGIDEIVRKGLEPDYVILLTGQDYPIATNGAIKEVLARSNGKSFLAHFSLPTDEWEAGGLPRIDRWHIRLHGRHYIVSGRRLSIERRIPLGLRPFGGSSYWCLSWRCVEYAHRFIRENPSYVRFFRYVDVPDEIFFQTIILNSPLRETVVNDDLRYVHWRDWNDARPAILGADDFETIMGSGKLFARKFDSACDSQILDMIDAVIRDDIPSPRLAG
jgi:Core-2/I-Branching enzyme